MKNAQPHITAEPSAIDSLNSNAAIRKKSTATEVQLAKLLALTETRPHHTHELRQMGISHPAGRVLDLVKRGYAFDTARITTVDGDGFSHRGVALYSLRTKPSGEVQICQRQQWGAAC
jgi:hypothetical protein